MSPACWTPVMGTSCTGRLEIDWLYRGAGRFFPGAWARFTGFAGLTGACRHHGRSRGAFLDNGVLIREAGMLAGIPGVLIHGRNDLGGGAFTPGSSPAPGPVPSSSSPKTLATPAVPR